MRDGLTRPNFFIVGAPKCGTSAWVEYLSTHPSICFSSVKEPHYFCTDFPGFRWAKSEDEYLKCFQDCSDAKVIAEASVQYLFSEDAANNIAAFDPNARILIMLRDPVSFLRSYHNQLLLNLDEDIGDFKEAWCRTELRRQGDVPKSCREPRFLDYHRVGRLSLHVRRFTQIFPPSAVKVMMFEDWIHDPHTAYLDLMAFLGIVDDGRTTFNPVHSAKKIQYRQLARLTQRPPRGLLQVSTLIKRLFGVSQLGLASKLRKLNTRAGYSDSVKDPELDTQIRAFFAEDQKLLSELIGKLEQENAI